MKRGWLSCVAVGCSLSAASAFGQTATTGTATDVQSLAGKSPTENLNSAAGRTPGLIVKEARARHLRLRDNRLAYQHGSGEATNGAEAAVGSGTGSTGTSGLSDALGNLINSGGLGSLAGLLGGNLDLGSLLGGTTGTGTDTTGSANSNIPSNLTPEVLQMLQGAGIDINEVFPPDSTGTSKSPTTNDATKVQSRSQASSILLDRWPGKQDAVSQTTDTTTPEESFGHRWRNEMALTFWRNLFTGITTGLSLPAFVENIEDVLRPALRPDTVDTVDTGN